MVNLLSFFEAILEKEGMRLRTTGISRTVLGALLATTCLVGQLPAATGDRWWGEAVAARLAETGTNRAEVLKALAEASAARREGMAFLIEHMPKSDLQSLSALFLLENLNLAYDAWEKSPWREKVSTEMFLNDVLPYACVNEQRDPWRAKLRDSLCAYRRRLQNPGGGRASLEPESYSRCSKSVTAPAESARTKAPAKPSTSGVATCTGLAICWWTPAARLAFRHESPERRCGPTCAAIIPGSRYGMAIGISLGRPNPTAPAWITAGLLGMRHRHSAMFRGTRFTLPASGTPASLSRWSGLPGDKSVNAVNVTDRYAAKAGPGGAEGGAAVREGGRSRRQTSRCGPCDEQCHRIRQPAPGQEPGRDSRPQRFRHVQSRSRPQIST